MAVRHAPSPEKQTWVLCRKLNNAPLWTGAAAENIFQPLKKKSISVKIVGYIWSFFHFFTSSSDSPFQRGAHYILHLRSLQAPESWHKNSHFTSWDMGVWCLPLPQSVVLLVLLSDFGVLKVQYIRIRRQLWNHMGQHNRLLLLSILDSVAISCC